MISTFVYPWDVAANGVAPTIEEFAALGVRGFAMSATYHPIAATSMRPQGPRPFHSAEGEVLFEPDPGAYRESGVTPLVHDHTRRYGFWSTIGERARAEGVSFDAWIVTVFQPWLARRHLDTARTYLGGDLNRDAVCPLAPRYQAYLRELVTDVVARSAPDRVILENLLFTAYDYGWIRPRTLVDVPATAARLLGLCFCIGCRAAGTDAGLDVEAFRTQVCARIDAELTGVAVSSDAFDKELSTYLDARSRRLGDYVVGLAAQVRTGVVTWAAEGYGMAELAPALGRAADVLLVHHADSLPEVRATAPDARLMRLLYVVDRVGGADEQRLAEQATAAAGQGFTEAALYNWGLVPKANFVRSVEICRAAGF